ncbi:hypothetical protein RFI_09224 [Reticulomyxa filosa]|uniref:Uncharacterized protein n=1 Tax=Reticulomyxa filosa TaxID=46433 RepID=X6NPS9_RETFI|nr:hypothetical protein RFI_09224 [Reticulomyxa filosa]|eukprot:ETO27908.1 hypothetical protein RFI_09224 [Reticulomyxa filosa]
MTTTPQVKKATKETNADVDDLDALIRETQSVWKTLASSGIESVDKDVDSGILKPSKRQHASDTLFCKASAQYLITVFYLFILCACGTIAVMSHPQISTPSIAKAASAGQTQSDGLDELHKQMPVWTPTEHSFQIQTQKKKKKSNIKCCNEWVLFDLI